MSFAGNPGVMSASVQDLARDLNPSTVEGIIAPLSRIAQVEGSDCSMVTTPSPRSKDDPHPAPRYLFVGPLRQDYIITPAGQVLLNQAGGGALYAAIGARLWTQEEIGIVSRVGENYPQEWCERLAAAGISTSGVRTLAGRQSTLSFWGYRTWDEAVDREPRVHFSPWVALCPRNCGTITLPATAKKIAQPSQHSPFVRMTAAPFLPGKSVGSLCTLPLAHPVHRSALPAATWGQPDYARLLPHAS